MNIFILHEDPVICASYHCDQHLHKMILESAQLLSTAAHLHFPQLKDYIYAPTHQNHPCSIWTSSSPTNMVWLCTLATELNRIRESKGCNRHSSMDIISAVNAWIDKKEYSSAPESFACAMYAYIKVRGDLNVTEKYQMYYRKKHKEWVLDRAQGMSYKGRLVPEFMSDLIGV